MQGITTYLNQELKIQPGAGYRIVRASNEPKILNVLLQINPKHLRRITAMAEELSMATGLAADQRLRLGRGPAGTISLEIPKPQGLTFNITARQLPHHAGIIGLDTMRRPARIDFANPITAHCLIAGGTGTGKTNTELLLTWSLATYHDPADARFILIDIEKRGRQWNRFQNLAHLAHPIIIEDYEAALVLAWCVTELKKRSIQNYTTPKIYIIIDELQSLIEAGGCTDYLARIARVGREFGLHLIVATQHPTIEALGDATFRRNLNIRLVSRVDDANAAYIATGQKNTGAETLTGPGDSILCQPGDISRLTIALLNPSDYDRLPRVEYTPRLELTHTDPGSLLEATTIPTSDSPSDLPPVAAVGASSLGPGGVEAGLTPAQIAHALATGRGITALCNQLGIGSAKATRLKQLTDQVRAELRALGYIITDTGEPIR